MTAASRSPYRVQIRTAPSDPSRYLWAIYGTQSLFYETSQTSYASVEQALAEANARVAELG